MDIQAAILISGASLLFAVYTGIIGMKHRQSKDDKQEASQLTTVIVKLENIGADIIEIKSEITGLKNDIRENREQLIKVMESAKQAHKRLDGMEKRLSVLEKNN